MTQQIKNRLIQSLAVLIVFLLPWYLGVQTIFGINIQIKPIDLNMPILIACVLFLGFNSWWTISLARHSNWQMVDDEPEIPEIERGHIIQKDSGNVDYDAITEYNFLKNQNYSADRWRELSSKYQGKQYRGEEWKQIRMLCLNKIKSSPEAVMTGKTIEFTL